MAGMGATAADSNQHPPTADAAANEHAKKVELCVRAEIEPAFGWVLKGTGEIENVVKQRATAARQIPVRAVLVALYPTGGLAWCKSYPITTPALRASGTICRDRGMYCYLGKGQDSCGYRWSADMRQESLVLGIAGYCIKQPQVPVRRDFTAVDPKRVFCVEGKLPFGRGKSKMTFNSYRLGHRGTLLNPFKFDAGIATEVFSVCPTHLTYTIRTSTISPPMRDTIVARSVTRAIPHSSESGQVVDGFQLVRHRRAKQKPLGLGRQMKLCPKTLILVDKGRRSQP
ncbi:hypothetical protein QBC38DRAFT_444828 [Podospora fimiseda]|uniref:Uncharacterized protein n=1 Tax=Podospora fimiseda TaxID=252190 RepID=A0AAN7GT08_9PEZI|nr:hypothetical protein QBC38DRAFT_444828 [Podospora fimiseda]